MINIEENVSLQALNTFGVDVKARYLAYIHTQNELIQALNWAKNNNITVRIFGGGSNLVLTKNIDALVLVIRLKGINIINEKGSKVIVEVAAGEKWHDFVRWAVKKGLGGVENLSLIHGTIGAAPVQNIGAYGVEFKDVCESVLVFDRQTMNIERFECAECHFSYRESIFKKHPERWIVLNVQIKLDSKAPLQLNYAGLKSNLLDENNKTVNYIDVSDFVCKLRREKLPDPKELGNAGSFFKNPIVSLVKAEELKKNYPDLPVYFYTEDTVKLAAGWLIDQAGFKGYREGNVGCYIKQALVLINYGCATGEEIVEFAKKVQSQVEQKFGVYLEPEPVFY